MTEYPQDPQHEQPFAVPQPGGQAFQQAAPMTPASQRSWAMGTHLSPFLASFAGGMTFLGPLIGYLVFKDRGMFIRKHAAEALNFQLTMWIGLIISFPLLFVGIGFLTGGAIFVAMLVCHILGAVAANEGREYRYPFTIRFVS
ncbi:MAG: uncharacterized protein QOE58_825 [Actinomycetota bacterium]|jgi:uncharacterized Tic20 family protein|nr:uncharacterized protein [Actinomycetota bacterium]